MIRWSEFLMPYETAVEELKNKFKGIRNEYRKNNEHSPIEFVVGRVKQVPSIIEKAKKLGLGEDEIDQLDDIGGIRIICQFEDDIYKIVEMVRAREGMDLEIVLEKDYVRDVKESGYRSYHIIIKYPIFTIKGLRFVFLEIQIRTMAMNFWATVEHSLRYKYKEELPAHVAEKLKSTAHEVYKLDKEMQEIRDEIISAQALFMHKSNTISQILSGIGDLERMERYEEAGSFRNVFEEINDEKAPNMDEKLEALANKIKKSIRVEKESLIQELERMEGNIATNV
ncbi:MAG: GTP pyrophosphokinase family protein [Clostridiales bacterium]|nr:GTP pyrophosphokinase family protein [Clostridiales bacterium]